jgi:hypothetical protein
MRRYHCFVLVSVVLQLSLPSAISISAPSSNAPTPIPTQQSGRLKSLPSSTMKHRNSEASTPGTAAKSDLPQETAKGNSREQSALLNFRNTIFPIYGKEEVKKFLLLGSIKFFIILALTLTRDTKDTLVVTQCGAEAIAFLKVRSIISIALAHVVPRKEYS